MPDPSMSQSGGRLSLAEKQSYEAFEAELRSKLPHLAERLKHLGVDHRTDFGAVLGTRSWALDFIAAHPEVSGSIELDCSAVEVLSSPVVFELLKAWPEATFVNANEDVAGSVAIVRERMP